MHTVGFFMDMERHIRTKWRCPYEALRAPGHPMVEEEGVQVPMRWSALAGRIGAMGPAVDRQAHSRPCK